MAISDIYDNRARIDQLKSLKGSMVPFVGAGFSRPLYPEWGEFLEQFFRNVREEFFHPEEEEKYLELKSGEADNKLELMADLLIHCSGRGKFEEEIKKIFDQPMPPEMKNKFDLLHGAFPNLKITTNFDGLIENSAAGVDVDVCRGNRPEELERLFTRFEQNSLLKIHGGIRDVSSIVLSTEQYESLYGHASEFDAQAPLVKFLTRVFTNCSVLFIGCSLLRDRTLMVLESLADVRPHFTVMRRPEDREELVTLNRRLSGFRIKPIWIDDFAQIEELLQILAPEDRVEPAMPTLDHGVPFVGREKELQQIKEKLEGSDGGVQMISGRLFSLDGAGGVGKTTLAIEAAKEYGDLFKDGVLPPIRVDEHTPMSFVAHLAYQFGRKVEEPPDAETAQRLVTSILKDRQALLILDNAIQWQNLRYMLPTQTRSTILVTTRNREIFDHIRLQYRDLPTDEVSLENFSRTEALALFQKMLADNYQTHEEGIYLEIAAQLGFLPLALRQAISLMLFGPHYTAGRLLKELGKEDRLKLLSEGHAAEGSDDRTVETVFDLSTTLLSPDLIETMLYLTACAPGSVPLSFLFQLTGDDELEKKLEKLYAYSWCERREAEDERAFELHQLVRELMHQRYGNPFSQRLIEVIHNIFTDKSLHFSQKEPLMIQLNEALMQAAAIRDEKLVDWLYNLYDFLTYRGYYDFYVRLAQQIEELFPEDKWTLRTVYAHRALIFKRWGRLEEALALHKKEEQIKEELGDRAGLSRSYGNQALILRGWGRLEEALSLHKKEEQICEELGDRAGLAASYGNQALILRGWGRLEEALSLHQEQEQICEELGNRAGLALSYSGQGLILYAKGQLKEAMEYYKKEERLCEELGDRAGLSRSYGNQALILRDWSRLEEALSLHQKQEHLCEELGDRAGLSISYGNQALILSDWGRLEEALSLHQKEEQIKEELGNRAGLAITWWNLGIIYGEMKEHDKKIELWRKSIEMKKSIGIPVDDKEKALEALVREEGK